MAEALCSWVVCPFVRPSVCYQTCECENELTGFAANWHEWFTCQGKGVYTSS